MGEIVFFGSDGTDFAHPAVQILASADGGFSSNTHYGRLTVSTASGGATLTERLRLANSGKLLIGGLQADADTLLHVWNATAGSVAAVANTVLTLENSTHAYLSILTPNDTVGGIVFGDVGSNVAGRLLYTHDPASPQGFQFYVETALAASLNATGLVLADASTVNISTPLLAGADHTATGLTAQMLAGGAIAAFDP